MFCSKCGKANAEGERFCRSCGRDLPEISLATVDRRLAQPAVTKDPDELSGKGVGKVIIGDGFFMVALILAATTSSVSSILWLFLLIPAFYFFGKGFAEVFEARQIRRRLKAATQAAELPPGRPSAIETFGKVISGELTPIPSVTERTTRDLK